MDVDYELFCKTFDDSIIDHVHKHVHLVNIDGSLSINITSVPYSCTLCSPQFPCTIKWKRELCLNAWINTIVKVSAPKLTKLKSALYAIPEVRDNIPACLRISPILDAVSHKSPMFTLFVQKALQLAIAFPYLNGNSLKIMYNRADWSVSLFMRHSPTVEFLSLSIFFYRGKSWSATNKRAKYGRAAHDRQRIHNMDTMASTGNGCRRRTIGR